MINHILPEQSAKRIEPSALGLVYTNVQRVELNGAKQFSNEQEEACFVIVKGAIAFTSQSGESGHAVLGDVLYLPIHQTLSLTGKDSVVTRFGAPCTRQTAFAHIKFADVDADSRHKTYGSKENGTFRHVWNMIDEHFDSSRFLVGICYGSLGGWTAWPPHEHGDKREEVYCYFDMQDGFAIQCVYDDLQQEEGSVIVQEGHIVAIPTGYHPNVGCPKTGIRYVYCMVSTTAEDRNFMDLKTQQAFGTKLE